MHASWLVLRKGGGEMGDGIASSLDETTSEATTGALSALPDTGATETSTDVTEALSAPAGSASETTADASGAGEVGTASGSAEAGDATAADAPAADVGSTTEAASAPDVEQVTYSGITDGGSASASAEE
jgi:hypothetical protein